jgi:molybdenum cofactor cytidylyltransferase
VVEAEASGLPPGSAALSAIVLAAGLSRRMGGPNKLLLPVSGVPLVRRVVDTLACYPFVELVVVVGHQATQVSEALRGTSARIVLNPSYEEGQMTSVRAGLAALVARQRGSGVLVALGDQPALTEEDIHAIATGFLALPEGRVLVPTFGGARGNPIVLSRAALDAVLSRPGGFGCRQFIDKNRDRVTTLEMPNDHVLRDVDLPSDYAALA